MVINVKNVADYKDKSGLLAKRSLIANQLTNLYQVNSRAKFCRININVVNPTSDIAHIKIWISDRRDPAHEDLYESKIVLEPDAIYSRTEAILSANEILFVQSNTSDVVIRLDGFEDNPL